MMRILFPVLLLALVVYPACTKKDGAKPTASIYKQPAEPADVVKQFVELSAGAKNDADREKLQNLCVGEMRRAFERMSPEAFKITYLNSSVKIKSIQVTDTKTVDDNNVSVTYEVAIENAQGSDTTAETNRRTVELSRSQGVWLIASIRPEGSDKIAFTRGMYF